MNILKLIIRIIWICATGMTVIPVIYLIALPAWWATHDESFLYAYEEANDWIAKLWGIRQ